MILPTKHIPADQCLMSVGATLLENLHSPKSISKLWEDVKSIACIGTYERFILGMDFLFIVGLVDFNRGKVEKIT